MLRFLSGQLIIMVFAVILVLFHLKYGALSVVEKNDRLAYCWKFKKMKYLILYKYKKKRLNMNLNIYAKAI